VSVLALTAALASAALLASCSGGKDDGGQKTAMVVNGQNVTQQQISEAAELFRKQQMMVAPEKLFEGGEEETRRGAARGIAGNMLMLEEVKARQWQPDEALVNRMASRFISQFPSREEFEAQLAAMGETEESMRRGMGEELLLDSLLVTVTESVAHVAEEEAAAHYEANRNRYVSQGRVKASQIILQLAPTASDSIVRATMELANEVLAKARAGENFDTLVKTHSSMPNNADMGWFGRGELIPEMERMLFSMKTGEVNGPAPSGMGLHILKKTDEEEPRQMTYEEVASSIKRTLEMTKRTKAINDYVEGLIAAANIKFTDASLDFIKAGANKSAGDNRDKDTP